MAEWSKWTYQPYKTNQVPSNVSADAIVEAIQNEARKYEGPISYTILKPRPEIEKVLGRPAPVLWLFGDHHNGRNKCDICDENDAKERCLTFYSTLPYGGTKRGTFASSLESIGKKLNIVTDYHLEFWPKIPLQETVKYNRPEWEDMHEKSAIYDNIHDMFPCISKDKERCHVPNLRVHVANARDQMDYFDHLLNFAKLNTFDRWRDACDAIVSRGITDSYERLKNQMQCLILIRQRIVLGPREFAIQYACSDNILSKHSKVSFELLQLPSALQKSMCSYLSQPETLREYDKPDPTFTWNGIRVQDMYAVIKKWYDDNVTDRNLNFFYTFGVVGTMDLYWLARVLKSPLGGLPSQLSCIYVGNLHVVNYMRYLTTCMPYYDVVQIAVQDDIYTSKCIHVPKPPHPRTQKQNDIIRFFMQFYDYFEDPSELISPLLFMSEICRYASSTVWDKWTDFLYWDRVINTHLDWRSFFYDCDSALRFLKEDDKIIPLVRYVSPTILNTPGLLVELAKRTACVSELKKYNRSFDSTDIKNELIDVMNSTSSHRLQRNIREVLTHCFMGWQSNDEESLPSYGKMAVARKSKIAVQPYVSGRVRPYLPRKAKADTHHSL